jgi:hypothetical protein
MNDDENLNTTDLSDGDKKTIKKNVLPIITNAQKGLISIGIVAGAAFAISRKKGMLAILGFMWLGSVGGGGLAYLFKKELK